MRDSWGKNFRTKDGRKVALTGCSRSSETQTQLDRRQGSGRLRSARTDENIYQVNDMVLSQEDQPRTHSTVREISLGTGVTKSSVVRIIKSICSWNASRGDVRTQQLSETNCIARMKRSKLLLKKFFSVCCHFVYNFLLIFINEVIVKIG